MPPTPCPPLAQRITKSLLGYGVIAGPCYIAVVAAQAFSRRGFDPVRHEASLLSNGHLGWVQIANFVLTGAMTIAAAVGVGRALGAGRDAAWAAGLIGAFGAGLIGAGIFRADPAQGFPPGSPPGRGAVSWHGLLHAACGGVGFLCVIAACFVLAARFSRDGARGWAWYSRITGVLFAAGFAGAASGSSGPVVVLTFTAAVVILWVWLASISVKLYRGVE
jgi:hypothetical protein